MRRERIMCNINVDSVEPNVLLIRPFHLKDFEDDSIYEFKLPDIYATNGTVLKAKKIKYITKPSIMYASIDDIRRHLGEIDISDEIILYQIREASRLIEAIILKAHSKDNVAISKEELIKHRGDINTIKDEYPLVWHFVTFKACYESLSSLYVYMVTKPNKVKELLSDLSKEFSYDLNALKDLLDDFKDKYEDILDQILTFADPTTALRGRTAMPINIDLGAPYYKLNGMNGYNRSYNSFGYHRGGY